MTKKMIFQQVIPQGLIKPMKKNTILSLLSLLLIAGCEKHSGHDTAGQETISISGIQLGMDQQAATPVME